jgi:transposase
MSVAFTNERGFDAGKKITGRKRHVLVDTLGLIWLLVVHPANLQDRDRARLLLTSLSACCYRLRLIWADGGYADTIVGWVAQLRSPLQRAPLRLEIVKRSDSAKGFMVLPKRWIVERTFGWLSRSRRLCKDYETQTSHSQAMVLIAMCHLMLKRLHNKGTFKQALREMPDPTSCLISAVLYCDPATVQAIIRKGVNVNNKNNGGFTPLDYAIIHRRSDMVEVLLKNGADASIKKPDGDTVLEAMAKPAHRFAKHDNDPKIVKLLKEAARKPKQKVVE